MNELTFAGYAPDETRQYHTHKGYGIVCCTERGQIVTENAVYCYGKDDVALIPPLLRHRNAGAAADLHVILEKAMLSVHGVRIISGKGAAEITEACAKAGQYFDGDFNGKDLVLSASGDLIAALLAAYLPGNGFSPVVANLLAEIDGNLAYSDWALDDCMRALPLNYDYIRKLFKKEVGLTPHEYMTARRMERARDFILSGMSNRYSNYTVSQIAEMCGYSEPLYFSRVFKKYYGVAPSELR